MFETSYEPLSDQHPDWGRIAVLPWDCEIFGFPVADYQGGDLIDIANTLPEFKEAFNRWTEKNRVELVHCIVPAQERLWLTLLPEIGFSYVDYTLKISTNRLHLWEPFHTKIPVRPAVPADRASIERIAELAFHVGRYHMDPRFPRPLSELRYQRWLGNALDAVGPQNRLYVTGEVGAVTSFFHVTLNGEEAYITIIAVDPARQGGRTGIDLCCEVLKDLKASGVRKMSSKISAMNNNVQNFCVYFGWRFSDPQVVFHWHAPNAPHLVKWEEVYE